MERRTIFPGWALPVALIAPQLLLTCVFFLWPAAQAIVFSLQQQGEFGDSLHWVGFANYTDLLTDPMYRATILRTIVFCGAVAALSMGIALLLAVFADHELRFKSVYRTLLIWPYAVAPVLAAVLFVIIVDPHIGFAGRGLNTILHKFGASWDYKLNGTQAMLVVILVSAWKQISYNVIFFIAGLQSVPKAIIEAARMDGARGWRRFRTITLPMLLPTIFFLLVVNLVYAAFDTFGTIDAMTKGGPGADTVTAIVKVYRDGHVSHDLGSSSAQSVLLMLGVIALTAVQFRFMGKRQD